MICHAEDVDDMMRCNSIRKVSSFILSILILFSGLFSLTGGASESDTLVSAVFDIAFISGTKLKIDVVVTPQKLTTDKIYFFADILQASS